MKWSLQIARIDGTDIKIHWSFILVVPYIWFVMSPNTLRGLGISVTALVLVFGCILLHELGHSMVANRLGVPTKTIILWPLGGFALLSRVPERPEHQLAIYSAGPLVNLVLAFISWLLERLLYSSNLPQLLSAWSPTAFSWLDGILSTLMFINLILAAFNLLPAYPLDGGRILHAFLHLIVGLKWAKRITLALSWLLVPVMMLLGWWLNDWIIIFVALMVFIFSGTLNKRIDTAFDSGVMWVADRGTFLLQRGDFAGAVAYNTQVLAKKPNNAHAYVGRGHGYLNLYRPDLALADYNQALTIEPDRPYLYLYRSNAYFELDQHEHALADSQQSAAFQPESQVAHDALGFIYFQLNDPDQTLIHYQRAINQEPEDIIFLLNKALVLLESNPYQPESHLQAAALFKRVLEINPQFEYAYFGLGFQAALKGDSQQALAYFEQASTHKLRSENLFIERGSVHLRLGDFEQAERDFERACKTPGPEYFGLLHRGRLRFMKGDQTAAKDDWGTLLRWGNRAYLLFSELWLLHHVNKQLDWALAYYAFAEQLLPDRAEVHCGRADAYRINQHYAEALTAYNQALDMNAELARAWYGRGLVNKAIGQPAYLDFQRAIKYTSNSTLRRWAHEQLADAV